MSSQKRPLLDEHSNGIVDYSSVNTETQRTGQYGHENHAGHEYRPHPLRWYILAVLCVLNISNAMGWISFAAVPSQSADFYSQSDNVINGLAVIYMVATIPCGLLAIWILDTHGLRAAFVIGSWLNFLGLLIRFLSTVSFVPHGMAIYVVYLGQLLAAMAQAFFLFSPTKLAATWFPDNHRALANTIGSTSNPLGILIAFVTTPLLVRTSADLPLMLGIYVIPGAVGCLMATLCIYKGVPPVPPSPSAAMAHEPFYAGVKKLFTTKAYVMLFISFGAGFGLFSALTSLLAQIVCVKGYDDIFAGLCGALQIVGGFFGAIIWGIYVDSTKKFGLAGKVTFTFAVVFVCVFYVASQFENQKFLIAASIVAFGFFGFASLPISYELGVEATYPVAEGTSGGFLAMSGQIQGIFLLLIGQYLGVDISPQDMEIQQCLVPENATTPSYSTTSLSTTANPANNIKDLRYTVLFFAVYAVIATFVYIFGVRTKYHRLLAEESGRLEDDSYTHSTNAGDSLPVL